MLFLALHTEFDAALISSTATQLTFSVNITVKQCSNFDVEIVVTNVLTKEVQTVRVINSTVKLNISDSSMQYTCIAYIVLPSMRKKMVQPLMCQRGNF